MQRWQGRSFPTLILPRRHHSVSGDLRGQPDRLSALGLLSCLVRLSGGVGTSLMPRLSPGTLVRARQRDWVVLSQTMEEVVRLRPVDGTEADAIGLFSPLDGGEITEATYPLPDPSTAGDFAGARLVYDAVRLNLRSGAGPFRSLGRLSVWPRPYQYVPLLMALISSAWASGPASTPIPTVSATPSPPGRSRTTPGSWTYNTCWGTRPRRWCGATRRPTTRPRRPPRMRPSARPPAYSQPRPAWPG